MLPSGRLPEVSSRPANDAIRRRRASSGRRHPHLNGERKRALVTGESNFTFSNMFIKVSKTNITISYSSAFSTLFSPSRGTPGDA
jgi:hypothetical protein